MYIKIYDLLNTKFFIRCIKRSKVGVVHYVEVTMRKGKIPASFIPWKKNMAHWTRMAETAREKTRAAKIFSLVQAISHCLLHSSYIHESIPFVLFSILFLYCLKKTLKQDEIIRKSIMLCISISLQSFLLNRRRK